MSEMNEKQRKRLIEPGSNRPYSEKNRSESSPPAEETPPVGRPQSQKIERPHWKEVVQKIIERYSRKKSKMFGRNRQSARQRR